MSLFRRLSRLAASTAVAAVICLPSPLRASPVRSALFPVAPHSDVTIEWWYLYTHLTTRSGQKLATVISFFRLGNVSAQERASGNKRPAAESHYLIDAVTDETASTHRAYSLADGNSLKLIRQLATLEILENPSSKPAQKVLAMADRGRLPPPTRLIVGACHVAGSPEFAARYGNAASLTAVPGRRNTYRLVVGPQGSGTLGMNLVFTGLRPPMYVGGNGDTGVVRPSDMKYVSLTRCNVTGTIDTGAGPQKVASGTGWFDHQWGDSWTGEAVGWDWWGIQLSDGRDVLVFRQRRLADDSIFGSVATVEGADGALGVYRHVRFHADSASRWTSPATGQTYPLRWTIDFGTTRLSIAPVMDTQEMPILAGAKAIWEGSVRVSATDTRRASGPSKEAAVPGVGYMELVGYGSPAVAAHVSNESGEAATAGR